MSSHRLDENHVEEELMNLGRFPILFTGVRIFDILGIPPAATLPLMILFGDDEPQTRTLRHEMIHHKQYKELCFIFFLPLYFLHVFLTFPYYAIKHKSLGVMEEVYYNNPFEQEAYANQCDPTYLKRRPRFAWIRYLFNRED